MYFHVVYGGDRRRYGGAGRNSHNLILIFSLFPFSLFGIHTLVYFSFSILLNLNLIFINFISKHDISLHILK